MGLGFPQTIVTRGHINKGKFTIYPTGSIGIFTFAINFPAFEANFKPTRYRLRNMHNFIGRHFQPIFDTGGDRYRHHKMTR